jgi:hypothetical protein
MNEFVVCGLRGGENRGVPTFPVLSFEPQSDLNLNYHVLLNCPADTNEIILLNHGAIKNIVLLTKIITLLTCEGTCLTTV